MTKLLAKQRLEASDAREVLKKIELKPQEGLVFWFGELADALDDNDQKTFESILKEGYTKSQTLNSPEYEQLTNSLMAGAEATLDAALKLPAGNTTTLAKYFYCIMSALQIVCYISKSGLRNPYEDALYIKRSPCAKYFNRKDIDFLARDY